MPCLTGQSKEEIMNGAQEHIQDRIDQYTQRGSDWPVDKIIFVDISAGINKPYKHIYDCNSIQPS